MFYGIIIIVIIYSDQSYYNKPYLLSLSDHLAMAGAPRLDVQYDALRNLLVSGSKKTAIARHFGLSRPTLDRIIFDYGLQDLLKWYGPSSFE